MSCKLRRRRSKDQPAVPGIHGLETQHVAQESTDLVCILGIQDGVETGDHAETLALMNTNAEMTLLLTVEVPAGRGFFESVVH